MLAHHPITGKEIRIIQTKASVFKENKTLVFSEHSVYDTIYTSGSPTYLIQLEPGPISNPALLIVTERIVRSIDTKHLKNLIILEELHKLYPHLGAPWDGTLEDAVIMVAGLLRYKNIMGIWSPRAPSLGLAQTSQQPLKLWWVTQYYTPSSAQRHREIKTCLERNANSSLINKIILLNEKTEDFPVGKVPIEQRVIGRRLTYADVMHAAADFPDVIVAFANADICIDDESWRQLWNINLDGKFLAILRYDVPASWKTSEAKLFGPRADSQDTWVIKASEIQKISYKNMNIPFGKMGCDNAIAMEMLRQKLVVVNPALSLKTWHFHSSEVRGYVKTDVVDAPMFHYISPSGFHDLEPVLSFSSGLLVSVPLALPILGSAATAWIVAKNKLDSAHYKLESDNLYVPKPEHIVKLSHCFQTSEGLAFDRDRMYIGSSKKAHDVWSEATMSPLTPSIECKRGLIIPWAGSCREQYILHYLSKAFRMKSAAEIVAESWEIFCPEEKSVVESLEIFRWNTKKLPVIKHEKDILVWCEEALCMPVSDNACVLSEDIDALRSSLRVFESDTKKLVFVQDGKVLTDEYILSMEAVLDKEYDVKVVYPGKTSAHRMIEVFSGAYGVVCKSGIEVCGWNWVLPKGAYVFECSTDGNASGLEISAAAGLRHFFIKKENLLKELAPSVAVAGPVIWVPRSDLAGYFSHPGDSFREMVRLWGAAGLCQVKEHPTATMVWWNKVGKDGVLLYDRPNHDWRLAAPAEEQEWSFALFGNPKPFEGSPWFFWPRRPELVEAKVTRPGWKNRSPGAVFYGKIENKVQERRRPLDWESACSEWTMVRGSEPYPFTQSEYLDKLSSSRFGLCLAGYGYKCHREIECMAMGCVPLCAPDVDMTSYAVPPIEGVHYIRVTDPESVKAACEMSEDEWNRMSAACIQWWTENCSCAGSFQLTKRLIERKSALN